MQKYADDVFTLDADNNPVPSSEATVTVYETGTSTLVSIFSDNVSTPLSNPFTVNEDGSFEFYAANGTYDILIKDAPYKPHLETGILLIDGSAVVSGSFSAVISADTSLVTRMSGADSTVLSTSDSADVSVVSRLSIVDSQNLSTNISADTSVITAESSVDSINLSAHTSIVTRLSTVDSSNLSTVGSATISLTSRDSEITSIVGSADTSVVTRLSTVDSTNLSTSLSAASSASGAGGVSQSYVDSADASVAAISGDGTDSEARSMATSVSTRESTDISSTLSADTSLISQLSTVDSTNLSASSSYVNGKIIDEDDMASNLDTKVPTQQSVKAYVDAHSGSATLKGLAGYENLSAAYASATTVTIAADKVRLANTDNEILVLASLSETLDITDSGVNGLDTGSEAVSTWYHIWAIAKADGTLDGILSASATAPTLPSGYTYKCYLGAVYNNSSGDFVKFSQKDKRVSCITTEVLSSGTQTSVTSVSLAAAVPSTAKAAYIDMDAYASSGSYTQCFVYSDSSGERIATNPYCGGTGLSSVDVVFAVIVSLITAQTVYYKVTVGSLWMYIRGWEY